MSIEVSQAWLEVPDGGALASLSHSGTVAVPAQTATATRSTANDIQVSQAWLELPGTVAAEVMAVSQAWLEVPGDFTARDLVHAGTVPVPTQSASMFDIVGQINGGGTITEDFPHRSLGHAGTVAVPAQSAAMGAEGTLGPALLTHAGTVAIPTQVAAADVRINITHAGTVSVPDQRARIGDPVVVEKDRRVGPGRIHRGGRRYTLRIGDKDYTVDSPKQASKLIAEFEAQAQAQAERKAAELAQHEKVRARTARRAAPIVTVEPVEALAEPVQVDEMALIRAEAQAATERVQAMYEQALKMALAEREIAQRVHQDEIEALTALLL